MAVTREQGMNSNWMMTIAVAMLATWPAVAQDARAALISRAKSFELDTPYVPPPGDPLSHHTAGYAKIMCSAVFITGLDPEFAAENVGYFTSPHAERAKVGKPVIDRQSKTVQIKLPNGVTRTAKYFGDQGCVTLPVGKNSVNFTPHSVKSALPDASKQPWPMGDVLSKDPLPPGLDMAKVKRAIDAAFEPAEAMTAAVRLVDGQEPDDHAARRPHATRRIHADAASTDPGMEHRWRPAGQNSHRRHTEHVEWFED